MQLPIVGGVRVRDKKGALAFVKRNPHLADAPGADRRFGDRGQRRRVVNPDRRQRNDVPIPVQFPRASGIIPSGRRKRNRIAFEPDVVIMRKRDFFRFAAGKAEKRSRSGPEIGFVGAALVQQRAVRRRADSRIL